MKLRRRRKRQARIPVVSMADVAFLLIIFFICTTSFGRESGLQLKLPGAQTPDFLPTQAEVHISIDKSKQIRVDHQIVLLPYLSSLLYQKLARSLNKTVIIRADESVDWGTVVKVMDVSKTLEEQTGWQIGINVAVEDLSGARRKKGPLPPMKGKSPSKAYRSHVQ